MRERTDLPFPPEEYRSRLSRVRERMALEGLDAIIVHDQANVHYLTGFHTTGYWSFQALVLPVAGDLRLVCRYFEAGNAHTYSWLSADEVISYRDTQDPVQTLRDTLAGLGLARARVGFEKSLPFLSVADIERLPTFLPNLQIADASRVVERVRLEKSERELVYIRKAADIVSNAAAAAIAAVHDGACEPYVAATVYQTLLAQGCDFLANPPFVASGPKTGSGHATWGDRTLQQGDPVYFELVASVKRYHVPIMRTASVGPPSPLVRRLADASLAGIDAALSAMRPGTTAQDVDAAVRRVFEQHGVLDFFRHRSGYTVGVAYPPGWPEGGIMSLRPGNPEPLQVNMVFHLPLVLLVQDEAGVGFSETVLITPTGHEVLTHHERRLVVK